MRESMIFYRSFYEAVQDLPKEQAYELLTAVFEYALNGNEPNLSGLNATLFKLIKPQLQASIEKMEKHQRDIENGKKGAAHGKMGGRPSKKTPLETPPETPPLNPPKNPINYNYNSNYNLNSNSNVEVEARKKPLKQRLTTAKELTEFLQSETNFVQFYQNLGIAMDREKLITLIAEKINYHDTRGNFEKYEGGAILSFIAKDLKETKSKKPIFGRTNK